MKLFWKLFCSMVSVSILACAVGGGGEGHGAAAPADGAGGGVNLDVRRQGQHPRGENDMLRYALFMEAEGRVLSGREELARLAQGMSPTTGGHTISFRISAATGEEPPAAMIRATADRRSRGRRMARARMNESTAAPGEGLHRQLRP